jgi:hypothetical protein
MFIKVKTKEGNELLVNTAQIQCIEPQPGGKGCCIIFGLEEYVRTSTSFEDIEKALSGIGGLVLYPDMDELLERAKKGG